MFRKTYPLLLSLCFLLPRPTVALNPTPIHNGSKIDGLIAWLLEEGRDLSNIPFADVVAATAGVAVLPIDLGDPETARIIAGIGRAVDALVKDIRDPRHSVHGVGRINEVSGHLEDILLEKLNEIEGFICTFPANASGRIQRSGYPDLRLVDQSTGRVFYLDPKLYAAGSETSTFRTFYFEPKVETNKILDDAGHIIVGIAHGGRKEDRWDFLSWNLVDLHSFDVRLKAEFQASNRDLYRPDAILARSKKTESRD